MHEISDKRQSENSISEWESIVSTLSMIVSFALDLDFVAKAKQAAAFSRFINFLSSHFPDFFLHLKSLHTRSLSMRVQFFKHEFVYAEESRTAQNAKGH